MTITAILTPNPIDFWCEHQAHKGHDIVSFHQKDIKWPNEYIAINPLASVSHWENSHRNRAAASKPQGKLTSGWRCTSMRGGHVTILHHHPYLLKQKDLSSSIHHFPGLLASGLTYAIIWHPHSVAPRCYSNVRCSFSPRTDNRGHQILWAKNLSLSFFPKSWVWFRFFWFLMLLLYSFICSVTFHTF
jgi:hypothetical protein